MNAHARIPVLREAGAARSRVSEVELFFDLVFVFAITQLSQGLLADAGQFGLWRSGIADRPTLTPTPGGEGLGSQASQPSTSPGGRRVKATGCLLP